LGSASIAQVHRATLLDGRIVAVKVQRPGIGPKLLGDIQNLKNFAKLVGDALPIDYYKIFCEIENTLVYELDFLHEAQATAKVAAAVAHAPNNKPRAAPVIVPLPIPGLVSTRVMVLEFIDGMALSKLAAEMTKRGVKAGSPESVLLGKKLLGSLTDAYSSMIFGSGIIHGDPHPGNIFIMEGGEVCLLDCGQVKQLTTAQRLGLAELIVMVNEWEQENKRGESAELQRRTKVLADNVRSFGVSFKEGTGDDCAAAVALILFGNSDTVLPGGWAGEELSPNSPINQVKEFPQELVLLGRATVMIRGIANRLGIVWGLSDRWSKEAKEALIAAKTPSESLPIWSVALPQVASVSASAFATVRRGKDRIRFAEVVRSFVSLVALVKAYLIKKVSRLAQKYIPESWMRVVLRWYVNLTGQGSTNAPSS
jgi:aarF domain-containing kinase